MLVSSLEGTCLLFFQNPQAATGVFFVAGWVKRLPTIQVFLLSGDDPKTNTTLFFASNCNKNGKEKHPNMTRLMIILDLNFYRENVTILINLDTTNIYLMVFHSHLFSHMCAFCFAITEKGTPFWVPLLNIVGGPHPEVSNFLFKIKTDFHDYTQKLTNVSWKGTILKGK